MALEASDLNDGAILQATRQVAGTNDTVKFIITLPSGRDFSSEYFQNDRKREALHTWLQAVRDQIVFESEEAEAAAKRAFFEKQALERRQLPPEEDTVRRPDPLDARHHLPPSSTPAAIPQVLEEQDALSHAIRMVEVAEQRRGAAQAAYTAAASELGDAEKNLRRWTSILNALEQSESEYP